MIIRQIINRDSSEDGGSDRYIGYWCQQHEVNLRLGKAELS